MILGEVTIETVKALAQGETPYSRWTSLVFKLNDFFIRNTSRARCLSAYPSREDKRYGVVLFSYIGEDGFVDGYDTARRLEISAENVERLIKELDNEQETNN